MTISQINAAPKGQEFRIKGDALNQLANSLIEAGVITPECERRIRSAHHIEIGPVIGGERVWLYYEEQPDGTLKPGPMPITEQTSARKINFRAEILVPQHDGRILSFGADALISEDVLSHQPLPDFLQQIMGPMIEMIRAQMRAA